MLRIFVSIIIGLFTLSVNSAFAAQPLPPSQAFQLSAELKTSNLIILHWKIAKKYYLYRDKIKVSVEPDSLVQISQTIVLPQGVIKKDSLHGKYQAYINDLVVNVPLSQETKGTLRLIIGYQGCSADGFCYPPIKKLLQANISDFATPADLTTYIVPSSNHATQQSDQAYAESVFDHHNILFVILTFLGIGLVLAFTPCVLPMVPILSGIIVGHGKHLGLRKTFLLSLSYVLGMAITYAIAGMFVALLGSSIQVEFQHPWVILTFSGFLVLLALSLFGLYELQMPNRWQRILTSWSNRQKGGSYFGVFIMGSISSLIVSPCVTAPLIGVLSYIAKSGNIWLGGTALLALGIGMGIPLLIVGLSAGHILPKAGAWMGVIEKLMGLTMLGFAIWIASRVLPGPLTLFLWAVLLIVTAVFLGLFIPAANDAGRLKRGLGLVLFIYGIILMIGAALGNTDFFRPWENWKVLTPTTAAASVDKINFIEPHTMTDLNAILAKAVKQKKIAMLDFYADWCVSCVEMDKTVFQNSTVIEVLKNIIVIRADLTTNDEFSQEVLKHFNVIAPPTILFFNTNGTELFAERLVGGVDAATFLNHIKTIKDN